MHKKVLVMALAGLLLPVLAWASTPLRVHFDGHMIPVRETVQVTRTPAGMVRVRTWSWRGPGGTAAFRVFETRGARAPTPVWVLARMSRLQMQIGREMGQMARMEAALEQPLMAPPPSMRVILSEPMVIPISGLALALETRMIQPLIVRRVLLPARVIEIVPAPSVQRAQSSAPAPASAPASRPGPGPAQHPGIRI
ncbi:MAG: hypothetical protein HIU85_08620 [Proteobacteria bacterium]|nr:hypothetical protein [Pseudomonadota bacterium]